MGPTVSCSATLLLPALIQTSTIQRYLLIQALLLDSTKMRSSVTKIYFTNNDAKDGDNANLDKQDDEVWRTSWDDSDFLRLQDLRGEWLPLASSSVLSPASNARDGPAGLLADPVTWDHLSIVTLMTRVSFFQSNSFLSLEKTPPCDWIFFFLVPYVD